MLPRISRSLSLELRRLFTTTSCRNGQISNIGRAPIPLPPVATLTPSRDQHNRPRVPLGSTDVPLKPYIRLDFSEPEQESRTLTVGSKMRVVKEQRQMWGTTRTLIHNAIVGMTEGFSVPPVPRRCGATVPFSNQIHGDYNRASADSDLI